MNKLQQQFSELKDAIYMGFQRRNKSTASIQLCQEITSHILSLETRRRVRRQKDKLSFERAIELILADLLYAARLVESRWLYRPLGNDRFTNEPVKRVTFKKVIHLMEAAGFVESAKGGNYRNTFYDSETSSSAFHPGIATRFRVTEYLLSIAAKHGIETSNISQHYLMTLPKNVIKKRATARTIKGRKLSGSLMRIVRDDKFEALANQVKVINQYLDKQHLKNAVFNGYYRSFNMGDHPSFKWNKGGRLYCTGKESYQKLKKQERLGNIKINDESIVEVDINASYLSIFHGLNGYKLPAQEDLYKLTSLHRDIVKAWINAAFGKGIFPSRWPSKARTELLSKNAPLENRTMKEVGEIICESIPVLKKLPTSGITWADLMYQESQAIISTMDSLRENYNIPAYSMHDGLIVPVSSQEIVANEIKRAFDSIGLECRVKIETSKLD